MRAPIAEHMQRHAFVSEAAAIVRSCVHCGFCNATCPTYQLTGDELEGPRGRIYLIKSMLEDGAIGKATLKHLDQCLVCRNCETTCPSGVEYGRLLDVVRPHVRESVALSLPQRLQRWLLTRIVPYPSRLAPFVNVGRWFRPLLPTRLKRLVPLKPVLRDRTYPTHARRILLLGGCAQPVMNPAIDAAARAVFDALGITLERCPEVDCCGALTYHLGYEDAAVATAKANVDAWWPQVEQGAEAILATSSGCGVHLKEYARVLAGEPDYAERALAIQNLVKDPVEVLEAEALAALIRAPSEVIAFHPPCTLQHGQRLAGRVEALLEGLGWRLSAVTDAHLCCGSAGSYSLLHPATANSLRKDKLDKLLSGAPQEIITANIGCQLHLGAASPVQVRHWLELLADHLPSA